MQREFLLILFVNDCQWF